MDPVVFIEMKPSEAPRERSGDVWWRAIAEDGTRFDVTNSTEDTGWAVASSAAWARRDAGARACGRPRYVGPAACTPALSERVSDG